MAVTSLEINPVVISCYGPANVYREWIRTGNDGGGYGGYTRHTLFPTLSINNPF